MPHPRGGPCDKVEGRVEAIVPLVSMPHPRGGPCDFVVAIGLPMMIGTVSMPHPRGGPCDFRGGLRRHVDATVSMPHPRGGPCDRGRLRISAGA